MKKLVKAAAMLTAAACIISAAIVPVMAESEVETGSEEVVLLGGWELPGDIQVTDEAKSALEGAAQESADVSYEPVALLGTQIVAGTNYCLLCRKSSAESGAIPGYSLVYVYENLQGESEIIEVDELPIGIGYFGAENEPSARAE